MRCSWSARNNRRRCRLDGSDVLGAAADYHIEKPEYGDFMFPKLFGRIAQIYIDKYGASPNDLAAIAYKNYAHARLNPLAQMRDANLTYDCASQVSEKNPSVAPPLRVSDCSQITDGSAALILVSGKYLDRIGRDKSKLPRLLGFGSTTDYLALEKRMRRHFRPRAKRRRKHSRWRTSSRATCKAWKCTIASRSPKSLPTKFSASPSRAKARSWPRAARPRYRKCAANMSAENRLGNSRQHRRRLDRRWPSCRRDGCAPGVRSVSAADRASQCAADRRREEIPHLQHGRQPNDFRRDDLGPRIKFFVAITPERARRITAAVAIFARCRRKLRVAIFARNSVMRFFIVVQRSRSRSASSVG